jgi:probable HAF family extracellular repeat protein
MKRPAVLAHFLAIVVLCTLAAAQKYSITDLGVLGGNISNATSINDSGQVVGLSYINKQTAAFHAFLWTSSAGMHDLGTLGGTNSYGEAINDAGEVVGCADLNSSETHAYLWTQATGMQDLGTLGGPQSCAYGLNDNGQVVGYSTVTGNDDQHAFIWSASTGMQDLGVPASSNTFATSINDSGQAVGSYYDSATGYHAYLWTQTGGIVDLGNLGEEYATAGSINTYGEVVGRSSVEGDDTIAYMWTPQGGMRGLPIPPKYIDATAETVNSRGFIVGFTLNASGQQRATVWPTPTTVRDLNSVAVNSPIILQFANGVNRNGIIVGEGRLKVNAAEAHAFLATPTK